MSQQERDWLDWLKRARDRKMTQREAAERMGVSERWVRMLLRRMKKRGDAVVVHRLRGRASNRKLPAKTQKQALAILANPDWHDFGPTFAAEQLAKRHQIHVGKETLRGWMIAACRSMWQTEVRAEFRRCMAGGHGAAGSANWCNGILPSTIGWKVADRCVIWCG